MENIIKRSYPSFKVIKTITQNLGDIYFHVHGKVGEEYLQMLKLIHVFYS